MFPLHISRERWTTPVRPHFRIFLDEKRPCITRIVLYCFGSGLRFFLGLTWIVHDRIEIMFWACAILCWSYEENKLCETNTKCFLDIHYSSKWDVPVHCLSWWSRERRLLTYCIWAKTLLSNVESQLLIEWCAIIYCKSNERSFANDALCLVDSVGKCFNLISWFSCKWCVLIGRDERLKCF